MGWFFALVVACVLLFFEDVLAVKVTAGMQLIGILTMGNVFVGEETTHPC